MHEKFGIEHQTIILLFALSNRGVEQLIGTIGKMLRCASLDNRVALNMNFEPNLMWPPFSWCILVS